MDVDSMKVVDLKRELRALSLPVSGTKAELAERLKAALDGDGDALPAGDLSDEGLLEDDDKDQPEQTQPAPKEAPVPKAAPQPSTVIKTVAALQKEGVLSPMEDDLFSDAPAVVPQTNGDKTEKLKARAARFGLPEAKLEERAKKFGTPKIGETPVVDKQKLLDRAKRFNISVGDDGKATPPPKPQAKAAAPAAAVAATPADLEKLRKRAERFNTSSPAVAKADHDELLAKRKAKFESSTTPLPKAAPAEVGEVDPPGHESKRKRIVF